MCINNKPCAYHPITKLGVTIRVCCVCGKDDIDSIKTITRLKRQSELEQDGYIPLWKKNK